MKYDFDAVIPRKNTNSFKYDFARELGQPPEAIPMWVADMDFPVPAEVTARLEELVRHGIYGYSESKEDYFEAVKNWFKDHFGFEVQAEWLVKTSGVVFALAMAVRSLTAPGDKIIIQEPVYPPFAKKVLANGRELVINDLILENGRYQIDLDDFARKVKENDVKMFILCNPHNPVGRVWSREELTALGRICVDNGCLVLSDEIHCDFVRPGHRHLFFASLDPAFLEISVTCTAPSKTFNLAGLQASNIFIPNPKLREAFSSEIDRCGAWGLNTAGLVACQAAYSHGQEWLTQLKAYLESNLGLLKGFLAVHIPQIKLIEPEGTYLAWLDFRALGQDPQKLNHYLSEMAGVWLDDGLKFGPGGAGFQRMNLACPRPVLEKALGRLKDRLS